MAIKFHHKGDAKIVVFYMFPYLYIINLIHYHSIWLLVLNTGEDDVFGIDVHEMYNVISMVIKLTLSTLCSSSHVSLPYLSIPF